MAGVNTLITKGLGSFSDIAHLILKGLTPRPTGPGRVTIWHSMTDTVQTRMQLLETGVPTGSQTDTVRASESDNG